MRRTAAGLALPVTLFFVLVAFFAASAILTRVHYDAQASVMETNAIQREALARSALATLQAKLSKAGTEEGMPPLNLDGAAGLKAKAWIESEGDELFRLYARVEGGMGQPYVAQKVVRKRPVLVALDVVHVNDGDVATSDAIRYRTSDSPEWILLPSPKKALMWVEADRRGNIFATYFPILNGKESPGFSKEFIEKFVSANDKLVSEGQVNHAFVKQVAQALETNRVVDLNLNDGITSAQGNGTASTMNQPQNNPELVKPARDIADAVTRDSNLQHFSIEQGEWQSIALDLPAKSGQLPGRASSDGKSLYLPVMQPGADRLRKFDLEQKTWQEIPTPPSLTRSNSGPAKYSGGKTEQLLEVEATESGLVVAHHGDGDVYGLSVYDPGTQKWSQLPSPPATYIDDNGKTIELSGEAKSWGNLEVGDDGEVYVVWRTSEESAVQEYLASQLPPGVPAAGGPRVPPPNPGVASPGVVSPTKNIAPGVLHGGPVPEPPKEGSEGEASGEEKGPAKGSGSGPIFAPYEQPKDLVFRYKDDKWRPFRILEPNISKLGKVSGGLDGRIVAHDLKPVSQADRSLVVNSDGSVEEVVRVLGLDGDLADYFATDCGAKPVQGKFEFRETATY